MIWGAQNYLTKKNLNCSGVIKFYFDVSVQLYQCHNSRLIKSSTCYILYDMCLCLHYVTTKYTHGSTDFKEVN